MRSGGQIATWMGVFATAGGADAVVPAGWGGALPVAPLGWNLTPGVEAGDIYREVVPSVLPDSRPPLVIPILVSPFHKEGGGPGSPPAVPPAGSGGGGRKGPDGDMIAAHRDGIATFRARLAVIASETDARARLDLITQLRLDIGGHGTNIGDLDGQLGRIMGQAIQWYNLTYLETNILDAVEDGDTDTGYNFARRFQDIDIYFRAAFRDGRDEEDEDAFSELGHHRYHHDYDTRPTGYEIARRITDDFLKRYADVFRSEILLRLRTSPEKLNRLDISLLERVLTLDDGFGAIPMYVDILEGPERNGLAEGVARQVERTLETLRLELTIRRSPDAVATLWELMEGDAAGQGDMVGHLVYRMLKVATRDRERLVQNLMNHESYLVRSRAVRVIHGRMAIRDGLISREEADKFHLVNLWAMARVSITSDIERGRFESDRDERQKAINFIRFFWDTGPYSFGIEDAVRVLERIGHFTRDQRTDVLAEAKTAAHFIRRKAAEAEKKKGGGGKGGKGGGGGEGSGGEWS